MNNLVDLFESIEIKVDPKLFFENDDIEYFNLMDLKKERVLAQLSLMNNALLSIKEEFPLEKTGNWSESFYFDPDSSIITIEEKKNSLNVELIKKSVNYLNDKYIIDLSSEQINKLIEERKILFNSYNFLSVVKELFNSADSIREYATKKLIEQVKFNFFINKYRENALKAEIKNSKIILSHFSRFDGWNDNCFYYYNKEVDMLLRGFSFFENKSLNRLPEFNDWFPFDTNISFSDKYFFPESSFIESIKFFKNYRLDITFRNNLEAQRFFNLFTK